jgi:multicomponent Na+:H+ antiporter subunit B
MSDAGTTRTAAPIVPRPDEQLQDQALLRVVAKITFPFMLIYALYVVFHGELSPGGGFQGGVSCAAAFVLYGLVFGVDELRAKVPTWITDAGMAIGCLVYAGTGLVAMLKGGNFLDYAWLKPEHAASAEVLGMAVVEYGVGITVTCVFITIYVQLCERGFAFRDRPWQEGE